jgi:hypothetical protein
MLAGFERLNCEVYPLLYSVRIRPIQKKEKGKVKIAV